MRISSGKILFLLILGAMLVFPSSGWANVQEAVAAADSVGMTADPDVIRWGNMVKSLFSWGMWEILLGGLKTTLLIFVFAAIAAIVLGAVLAYLAISHKCSWLFKPLNWFVTTVHDIPSVALMMLF